ncbi:hypothetical protein RKD54_003189 [Pseudarthrobacter sp. SLBN-100]
MMRRLHTVVRVLALGLVVLGLSACMAKGPSTADRLENDMHEAAMSVAGIESAEVDVILNTSGKFITVKLVGSSYDEAGLTKILGDALPPILATTEELESGSFAIGIFSPDDAVSAGAGTLGYSGGKSLSRFREFFLK